MYQLMKKVKLLFAALMFVLAAAVASAQNVKVAGQVLDQSGEPVPGATVMVKGTATGVSAGADGTYTITVPSNATLVFTSVGYVNQEVPVNGRASINVSLATDTTLLDDAIVVAFGTTTKEAFTGSAAVVKADDIQKHVTTNVANTLVGNVAGLQMKGASGAPGAGAGSMNIRGIASLYAGTDPLIIVDGAPNSASLSNIPTSDIESVSVLKDAASAALYGARGAAGVIIITTKRGEVGKAKITVDAKWGVQQRAIQDYKTVDDPGEYLEAAYKMYENYYFWGQGLSAEEANLLANKNMVSALGPNYIPFTIPEGEQFIGMDGKLNPHATLGRKVTNTITGEELWMQPDNWKDLAYRDALRQEYNISVNGQTGRMNYYSSLSYLGEDGVIEYSDFQRVSARLRADYQAKDWLKVGANVNYVASKTTNNPNMDTSLGAGNLMYYTTMIAPIYPAFMRGFDENGNVVILTDEYGHEKYDYGVAAGYYGSTRAFLSTGNPLGSNRWNKSFSNSTQINGTLTAEIRFTPHLIGNVSSTVIKGFGDGTSLATGFEGPSAGTNGALKRSMNSNSRTNNIQTLTYDNSFGDHNVNVLLGHEYYRTRGRYLEASARGAFREDIPEIKAFASVPKGSASSYSTDYNVEGYFASAQYNYQHKYYGSLSFRRDATSYFAKENRWGNFWSVGGAWIISKEEFFHAPWVDILKLKASIGQQGNDSIGAFNYIDLYSLSPADDTHMSASFASLGNKDITWETTTNFNVGSEFSFWKGRLSGEVNVYNKKTTDLLFWISVPESVGARGYYGNIGDIRNYGVELTLNGSIIRTRDFQWNANVNLSHNDTKVLSLPSAKTGDAGGFVEGSYWYEVGKPMYNSFRVRYAGVSDQGKALYWVDKDVKNASDRPGKNMDYTTDDFNEASYYVNGCVLPKVFGGFGTGIVWKNFDASVMFDFQLGGKLFDSRYASLMSPWSKDEEAGSAFSASWNRSWSPDNATSDVPRWMFSDQYATSSSDRFMTSASYLNFQSFTVGYTIPANKFFKEQPAVRIYAAGENLCFWSARKGLDPRYSYGGNTTVAVYSPTRNISAGIQLTF